MKNFSIIVMFLLAAASTCLFAPSAMGKSPAPAKAKPAAAPSGKDAESAEREKRIKSMMKSTLRSFSSVSLTAEQQQQAEGLFGKAIKNFVTKRADAMITDELQKKYAACLRETHDPTAKDRTNAAFARAGFTEEQIKVFESTQKALDKAKRDFYKALTDTQIAGLPKALQKSIKGEKP